MDLESRYMAYENVIHDIKTPICIINNALEVMSGYNDRPEWFDYYADILNKNTYRVYKLVNDACDAGKISNGNFEVRPAYYDIVNLTEDAVISARTIADKKKIEIKLNVSMERKRTAIDKDVYVRILLNLMTNAIKFTGADGHIEVSLEDLGGFFIVTISDDGIGVDPANTSHLFTRYHMGRANNRSGSGIGLNIARDLVDILGGEISFLNNSDTRGATVAVKIPFRETSEKYEDINYLYDFYYNNMTQIELSYAE